MLRICGLQAAAFALSLSIAPVFAGDALSLARPEIPLWPNGAPGSEGHTSAEKWNPAADGFHRVTNIHNPSITVFLPPKAEASGAAVIVCPGGGHQYLVMDLEGSMVAERLNSMGIAAFVLKSRLARAPGSTYRVEDSLADAQQALRLVRSRASEWNIKTNRVGIMGFSAGGEIAALAETRSTGPETRPDFAVWPIRVFIPTRSPSQKMRRQLFWSWPTTTGWPLPPPRTTGNSKRRPYRRNFTSMQREATASA